MYKMFAVIVWSFLNNAWCQDGQPFCTDQKMSNGLSDYQVASIGRRAFAYAMDQIGNANVTPYQYLILMNNYVVDHYFYSFTADEWNRINGMFRQHGVF